MAVIIVNTDEEIMSAFSLIKQLRPHLKEETYLCKIRHLQMNFGYKLVVVSESGVVKAAGYKFCDSLAWGRYLYVDDLITDHASRSNGFAKQIFDWLEEEAMANQCVGIHLDSGVQRHDAHRFYLNRKLRISCHHFEKAY